MELSKDYDNKNSLKKNSNMQFHQMNKTIKGTKRKGKDCW